MDKLPLTFLNPVWLALLPVVWILVWLFARYVRRHSMWSRFVDPHLLKVLLPADSADSTGKLRGWLLPLVLSLVLLAAAGPSWRSEPVPLLQSTTATVIVIDLSDTMQAQDVEPSRFQRALYKARDLIALHPDGQLALVAFAGAAFVVSPLTDDGQTLLNFIDSLKPDIMPVQGSRIDQAISISEKILSVSLSQARNIIILTDGAENPGRAKQAAREAASAGVSVSILALGTAQGGPLKDPGGRLIRDKQGQLVVSKVKFGELEAIARAGGGRFVKMTASDQDIRKLLVDLDPQGSDFLSPEDSKRTLSLPVNDGIWLVWLILPLALVLFRKNALWIVLVTAMIPFDRPAWALDWKSLWNNNEQQAYQAFEQGEYEQAGQLSANPQLKGSAWYRAGDFDAAAQAFADETSPLSDYNRGNALTRQQQFEQAIEAYDQALAKNPQLEDAQRNKALVEEFLKQQQNQQQQQDGESGEEKQNQQPDNASGQPESGQQEASQDADTGQSDNEPRPGDADEQEGENALPDSQPEQAGNKPDQESEQELAMGEQAEGEGADPQAVDRWLNRLPDDPSELLRRKFLRDYQRQRSTP